MSIAPADRMDTLELLAVSAIWGASFLCITIALTDLAPLEIAAWRLGGAALVLLAIVRGRGLALPLDRRWTGGSTAPGAAGRSPPSGRWSRRPRR